MNGHERQKAQTWVSVSSVLSEEKKTIEKPNIRKAYY